MGDPIVIGILVGVKPFALAIGEADKNRKRALLSALILEYKENVRWIKDTIAKEKELTDEGPWSSKWAITARNLLGFSHQDDIIPDYPPIRRADLNSEDSFDKTLSDYLLEANNHPEIVT